jgi:hypothetical protein
MRALPIACTLNEADFQTRRGGLLQQVSEHALERKPVASGYALRFAPEDDVLEPLFRLIQLERTCCAFLRFELILEPDQGPVWLTLTGPEGTHAFLDEILDWDSA